MRLSKEQFHQVHQALLNGYNESTLRQMVRLELGKELEHIAGGNNLNEIVLNLIDWAERHETIYDLIEAAVDSNPTNHELQILKESANVWDLQPQVHSYQKRGQTEPNSMYSNAPLQQTPNTNRLAHYEKVAAIGAGILCLGVLSFLLIRGSPFSDPTLAVVARTFTSLAATIFGAMAPGLINVKFTIGGVAIRAGSALIFFMITYLGAPHILPGSSMLLPAKVTLEIPNVVDIRSFQGPTVAYEEMLEDEAVVIVRMTYTNQAQPALNAFVSQEKVSFEIGDFQEDFKWLYFVNIFPGAGCWPCIEESVSTFTVPTGNSVAHETLFHSTSGLTWKTFIDEFIDASVDVGVFSLRVTVDEQEYLVSCVVSDLSHWRQEVTNWMKANGDTYPSRLILPCERPDSS